MKIEIEEIDTCNKRIKVEIPHADYRKKVNEQYAKVGMQISVPGFRKGKVPLSLIENRYGPEVKREVLTQIITESITHAIEEKGIRAVTPPSLLDVQSEEGTDIRVSASVEVLPDFTINDYSGIELEMKVNKVAEKEVDDVIEHYRLRGAIKIPVTDRPVQDKDFIKIDFKGSVDGEFLPGGESHDFIMQIGAQGSLPAFNEGVIGMRIGEEKNIPISYAADYDNKVLAGKTVNYHVILKEIQAQELPELNDEFAKNANPEKKYETLDEMKRQVRLELEEYEKKQAKKSIRKVLAEKIAEMNPITMPEGLIREQIRFMIKEANKKAGQHDHKDEHDHKHDHEHGHEHDHEHEVLITSEDEKTHRDSALKILREEILISHVSDEMKIVVSDEEFDSEIKSFLSMMGGGNLEKIKREWKKNGTLERLRARMKREKTLDQMLDKIRIKEEMIDRQ